MYRGRNMTHKEIDKCLTMIAETQMVLTSAMRKQDKNTNRLMDIVTGITKTVDLTLMSVEQSRLTMHKTLCS